MSRSRFVTRHHSLAVAAGCVMSGHDNLASALVAALADLTVIESKRTAKIPTKGGGEYSYSYADVGDVVKLTRPVLAAHGVVALTPVHDHGDGLACTVILLHVSGDKLELGPFPFPHGQDARATGSMVTYHRRYALVAALGMAAGDDDDGASAAPRRREQPRAAKPFDLDGFRKSCGAVGIDPADVLAHAELDKSLEELTAEDRPALKASLAALAKNAGGTGSAGGEKTQVDADGHSSPADTNAPELVKS